MLILISARCISSLWMDDGASTRCGRQATVNGGRAVDLEEDLLPLLVDLGRGILCGDYGGGLHDWRLLSSGNSQLERRLTRPAGCKTPGSHRTNACLDCFGLLRARKGVLDILVILPSIPFLRIHFALAALRHLLHDAMIYDAVVNAEEAGFARSACFRRSSPLP